MMIIYDWSKFNMDETIAYMKERLRLNGLISKGAYNPMDNKRFPTSYIAATTADCSCAGHRASSRPTHDASSLIQTDPRVAAINARAAERYGRKPALPAGFTADAGMAGRPGQNPTVATMNARAREVWRRRA